MFQCHWMILKSRMEIRLGGMPRIARFGKKAQVRYLQSANQLFFCCDTALVDLRRKNGMSKQKKNQD
jgi:hypothetical protein